MHTFLDMVGHWMKDSREEHFEFVHRIVSSKEEFRSMQNLKRWVSKIKSICLIATFFSMPINGLISHEELFARGVSLMGTLFHMYKIGQISSDYYMA